jgi:hypothetical protein
MKFKDKDGNIIKPGHLIVHGMLSQLWLVTKTDGELIATIVSEDSGQGYWEEVKHLGIGLEGNFTEIVGKVPVKLLKE